MADRTLRLIALYDGAQADEGLAKTATMAEDSGLRIQKAGDDAGSKFTDDLEKSTTKAGSLFESLGNSLSNWGIPFSGNLEKIGKDLDNVSTHGKGVLEAFSAIGGVATVALAGAAAEAVHLSDQFDKSQSSLETAVDNSGAHWSQYATQIDQAEQNGTKFGDTATQVAGALQALTTATDSPKKALNDLSLAENLAVLEHESLGTATSQLEKVLGGNTRVLATLGINLDVTSSKLHSVQTAEQSLQKDQLALQATQAEVNSGQLKGAEASGDLAKAHLAVEDATQNLQVTQSSQANILDALKQRTKDAGAMYAQTLPGEIAIAKASIEDLGIKFGEYLTPKIHDAEEAVGDLVGFFEKNHGAADALAALIGGPLAAAMVVFGARTAASAGKAALGFVQDLGSMAQSAVGFAGTMLEKAGIVDAAAQQEAASQASAAAETKLSLDSTVAAAELSAEEQEAVLAGLGGVYIESASTARIAMTDAAAAFSMLPVSAIPDVVETEGALQQLTRQMGLVGPAAAEMGLAVDAADVGMAAATTTAAGEIDVALGSTGVGLIVIGLGIAVTELYLHWHTLWPEMERDVEHAANFMIDAFAPVIIAFGAVYEGGKWAFDQLDAEIRHDIADVEVVFDDLKSTWHSDWAAIEQDASIAGDVIEAALRPIIDTLDTIKSAVDDVISAYKKMASMVPHVGITGSGGSKGSGGSTNAAADISNLFQNLSGEGLLPSSGSGAGASVPALPPTPTVGGGGSGGSSSSTPGYVTQAQSLDQTLESAATSDNVTALEEALQAAMQDKMSTLISELVASGSASNQALAAQMEADFQTVQQQLGAQLGVQQQVALADQTSLFADQLKDQTTLIAQAMDKQVSSIQDAATKMSDSMSATATAIKDATTAMNDATSAKVTQIGIQAQTEADILGERGLYGLNLEAQQQKVALDKMTEGYDKTLGALQQAVDKAQATTDKTTAQATSVIDQAAAAQNTLVQQAQANVDYITSQQDALVDNAQSAVDAASQGTELQQQQAAAALK